ncbi:restriction endonuclease subunit S [Corynebacterium casei]|uniref:restriction endonuclease subunit S n=1 Tax=Corynebacterium casei TaxID=160386 RepID=UPI003FD55F6B
MNKVQQLIEELCPEGVEFKKLDEITSKASGIRWSDLDENEARSYIDLSSVDRTTKKIMETATVTASNAPSRARQVVEANDVIFATTRPAQMRLALINAEYHGQIASTGYCVLRPKKELILPAFLSYALGTERFQRYVQANQIEGNYPSIPDARVRAYTVPVPPLPVQQEIVRILDMFTQLEAELEAELEARKRQYDHYRSRLLTPTENWTKTTLGEVAEVFDGPHATPQKTEDGPWYLSISSLIDGRFDLSKSAHLSDEDFPNWTRRVEARSGDTMFSYETRLGQAAFWDRDEPAALGRRMGLLRPNSSKVIPRFLTLVYLGPQFQSVIGSKTVSGSTVNRIPIRDMKNWQIEIPSLIEQENLVKTIDSFDTLVNDLQSGLPAEITARRKQYEYYRDKLLTFKELSA